jgi:hypothetical protein
MEFARPLRCSLRNWPRLDFFIGALQKAGKQPWFVGSYVFAAFIPLGAMVHILFAKNIDKEGEMYRGYDSPTIGFTRMASLVSAIVVIVIAIGGFSNWLPGQQQPRIKRLPVMAPAIPGFRNLTTPYLRSSRAA